MEKVFPDMPINAGLEKMLAVTTTGIGSSAHTLLSLSYLIIPVSLAAAIKVFHWLGPFAALTTVLIPVTALLYAEACLGEQIILPTPGGSLPATKTGKPVYSVDAKDEDKTKALNDLLLLVHKGAMPPEHNPTPYTPPTDASHDSNGNIVVSSLQSPEAGRSQFASTRPSLPQSDMSGTTVGGFTPSHKGEVDGGLLKPAPREDITELNQILQRVSETLYGKQLSPSPQSTGEAQKVLNKLRMSIGLPQVAETSLSPVMAAAKETASTVGC